jgi:hypothetical protein
VAFNGFGGTYTLLDHLYALGLFNHVAGGFDANGFDVRYSSRR